MKKPNEFPTGQGFVVKQLVLSDKQYKTAKAANPEM